MRAPRRASNTAQYDSISASVSPFLSSRKRTSVQLQVHQEPAAAARKREHGWHEVSAPLGGRDALVLAAGVLVTLLVVAPAPSRRLWSASSPLPAQQSRTTFYDDPELAYTIDRRVMGWDAKRAAWLRSRGLDPSSSSVSSRVVMVSGSQPEPCAWLLHPAMASYWAKIPVLRAAMLAHPEAEWVWWVDADAVLTDMDLALPLDRYAEHNLVVYGWAKEVYEKRSWVGLNAGVFLIRNCQWSLDFVDQWARMGPAWPETYPRWGKTLKAELSGKSGDDSDDQSALVYLLLKHRDTWGDKTHLATDYYFQGYWAEIVGRLDGVAKRYEAVEGGRKGRPLRRRHAEREHVAYAAVRGVVPGPDGGGQWGWRRPFVTHFTGCAPCSGQRNPIYSAESCDAGMRAALDFADDQVLRAYGFRHAAPGNDTVTPLPFDYPTGAPSERGSI